MILIFRTLIAYTANVLGNDPSLEKLLLSREPLFPQQLNFNGGLSQGMIRKPDDIMPRSNKKLTSNGFPSNDCRVLLSRIQLPTNRILPSGVGKKEQQERMGGSGILDEAIRDFEKCIQQIQLHDFPTKGFCHTWDNKREGQDNVQSMLDRLLVNEAWLDLFQNVEAKFLASAVFDHYPIIISFWPDTRKKPKPFKFFHFWMKHDNFKDILRQTWSSHVKGGPMFRVSSKLKILKKPLRELNNQFYSNISIRSKEARDSLSSVQALLHASPGDPLLRAREKDYLSQYAALSEVEENFYKQKSCIKWLQLGDANTSNFHSKV
ncbi:hypothetical protein F0562_033982 [Nyssa sinensis]|uniref:Endonuclease/exonuclease/phosphatase domain-containing protein n=1 Tax=Nyssa sinensis TaxID=561372 RepID=A0A5J5AG87_9ASTE|nr:hypothetical protein F0562_033982 [Nyssa sinensis]